MLRILPVLFCVGLANGVGAENRPQQVSSSVPVKISISEVPDSACKPYCMEVHFTRDVGHVFMVYESGAKQFLTTYFPQWEENDLLAPKSGEEFVLREIGKFASDSLKSFACGSDGWGFTSGEATFTPYSVPGGGTVTGVYTGAGRQSVTTTFPNGSGSSRGENSGFKPGSGAGSNPTCSQMRKELKDSDGPAS